MSLTITNLSQTLINGSKKIVLATALLLTVGISSSFATTNDGGNDAATVSFHKDFKKVEVIETHIGKDFIKFTFKMNGVIMSAFYNENGQLLAITRNIQSSQLPLQLLMQIKKDYGNYWISDLFEYDGDGSNSYYITLESADYRVILRSNGTEWELYDKKAKQ
jgi:hypothetical protein